MNKKLKSYFYNHFYRHFYNFFYQYYFIFFIHGFFTIIAQLVFVRELLACFYGNELFSGLVLGCWFLSAGLGSFLALKLAKIKALKTIIILQILMVLTLPLEIYILRWLIGKTTNFGQQPSITLSLLIIFILIFPFSFVLNAIFSWTTNLLNKKGQQTVAKIINISYLIETLGLVFGGLVFNFFLINTTFPFNSNLNKASLKFRFPNLIETTNSVYGNIVVTKENNQYSFYENGQFVYHNQEIENNESLAHLILIQHAKPENILIIGNGLNGLIDQVIKYPSILTIDYLNLDPKLTSISRKYLPDWLNQSLNDPRVKIIPIDGRTFLNQNNKKYDIIIINLPNPSTSLINRFYSLESFQLVEKSLKANGIFSTLLTVPVDYQSQEAINLSSLIIQTLKSVFPYQLLLPEDNTILILNAKNNLLSQNSKNLT